MISFRLMVDVTLRKPYYANCILVTHFKLIFNLLKGEKLPICIPCNKLLTVEHISTNCVDLKGVQSWGFFCCCFVVFL